MKNVVDVDHCCIFSTWLMSTTAFFNLVDVVDAVDAVDVHFIALFITPKLKLIHFKFAKFVKNLASKQVRLKQFYNLHRLRV